jgi:hypothetical protein
LIASDGIHETDVMERSIRMCFLLAAIVEVRPTDEKGATRRLEVWLARPPPRPGVGVSRQVT